MKKPFGKIIFGLILLILDIYVWGIDILPDPAAFLLIIWGIRDLAKEYSIKETAGKASLWASIPLVFSLLPFFRIETALLTDSFLLAYALFTFLFFLLFIYSLFQMMLDIARQLERHELRKKTYTFSKIYMTVFIGYFFLVFLMRDFPPADPLALGLALLSTVTGLALAVTFLIWLYRFQRAIG